MIREVNVTSGTLTLAGLLRLPDAQAPHPAVVLLPGSLPAGKEDARLSAVAEAFVAHGFAALTLDSRGTGASEGDFDLASFDDLADDAVAAVEMLRRRRGIRDDAVGIWGVSQGGTWVGPLAAERAGAAFLVAVSGPLVSPEDFMHGILGRQLRGKEALDEPAIERITNVRRAIWSYYARGEGYGAAREALRAAKDEPWFPSSGLPQSVRTPEQLDALPGRMRTFLQQKDFHPLGAISRLRCPVLAVYGAEDSQLPVAEYAEMLDTLASSLDATITVEIRDGTGHDIVAADPAEKEPGADALGMMARWAASQVAPGTTVSTSAELGAVDSAGAAVQVEQGVLIGEHGSDGLIVFRGAPFASPPVGELRWRAPEPPQSWEGQRDATEFAPACPQGDGTADYYRRAARRLGRDPDLVPALGTTSEDCLYLNVWTTAVGTDQLLPIFVWLHGGAGVHGSASDPLFDGAALARQGLVVVTVAYRLGALGFLAHPALSADDPRGVSGNYALLDVARALEWIRQNGSVFGGDPANVTLAGQSAGATLAHLLLTSPVADGLVHRLVMHSGNSLVVLRPLRDRGEPDAVASAEARGLQFTETLGLGRESDAAALRAVPVDSLMAAARQQPSLLPSMPVVDGVVLEEQPARSFQSGAYTPVPILAGFNDDETSLFMAPLPLEPEEYRAWVRQRFGAHADTILAEHPAGEDAESARRQRVSLSSDEGFRAPSLLLALWAERRNPVYLYRFSWRPDDGAVGAFHSAEVPFLFGTHGMWWNDGPEVRLLSETMQRAWRRFAATGTPAVDELPTWAAGSWNHPKAMVMNLEPGFETLPRLPALRLFVLALASRLTGDPVKTGPREVTEP